MILDSDVKYPNCKLGDTARRCENKYKKKESHIEVKILDVHEAENLVPLSFMKMHTKDNIGKSFLKKMDERGLLPLMKYYDIKKGIRKDRAMENAEYLSFCRDLYERLYPFRRNSFEKFLEQKRKNDDRLFPVIREDMLSIFNAEKDSHFFHDILENERKGIADLVHTFVCCRGDDPIN